MRDSLAEQLRGLTMPDKLHPKRQESAKRISTALHRAERLAARLDNAAINAALKDIHDALADGFLAHGAEIGLGVDITPYSGGLPK